MIKRRKMRLIGVWRRVVRNRVYELKLRKKFSTISPKNIATHFLVLKFLISNRLSENRRKWIVGNI
jgi:hypothetical protein